MSHKCDFTHGHHQMVTTEIRLLYSLQPKMEKIYTVSKNKTGSRLWLRFLIAKFRLKLKKVETTTRPFRYVLNQIPYDYTGEGNGTPLQYSCLENPMDGGA